MYFKEKYPVQETVAETNKDTHKTLYKTYRNI